MLITKQYETETAHKVLKADSEMCRLNFHGHSYVWQVSIASYNSIMDGTKVTPLPLLNEAGMIIDFGSLGWIKEFIMKFDHAMVLWDQDDEEIKAFFKKHNKRLIIMKKNTTAENMSLLACKAIQDGLNARYIKEYITTTGEKKMYCPYKVHEIKVFETRTGSATSTPGDTSDEDTIVYLQGYEQSK